MLGAVEWVNNNLEGMTGLKPSKVKLPGHKAGLVGHSPANYPD
jgi:hypothetical protein